MSDGPAWSPPGEGTGPWPPPGQGGQGSPGYGPPGSGAPGYGPPGSGPPGYGPPGNRGYGPPGYQGYGAPWPPAAPRPGVIPLRPIGLGEILDGSITTIRQYPKATLGFTAIIMTIATLISTSYAAAALPTLRSLSDRISAHQTLTTADLTAAGGWLALSLLVNLVVALAVSVILTGTLTSVVARAVLGQEATVAGAWRHARGRLGSLAGLTLLLVAIFILLWAVLIGLAIGAPAVLGPAGLVITFAALITLPPMTIFLWVKTSLAASAVVLERIDATTAIRRSWLLTRRSFWRVFGIWIVAVLVSIMASAVLEVPFRIIDNLVTGAGGIGFGGPPSTLTGGKLIAYLVIGAVGSLLAATVIRPMLAGVAALLYIDLRMRREGLDMALQTAAGRDLAPGDDFASVWEAPPPGTWQGQGSRQSGQGPWPGPGPGPGPGPWEGPGSWQAGPGPGTPS